MIKIAWESLLCFSSSFAQTNKTISGSSNTITNIPNSAITNSTITVSDGSNSTAIVLWGYDNGYWATINLIQLNIACYI